jgi:hypothetical protein
MADDFMHDVGFRSVVWISGMANILSAAKNSEGETVQKLSLTENTVSRLNCEPGLVLEIGAQFVELGNSFREHELFLQLLHLTEESFAHSFFMETSKLLVNPSPEIHLFFGIGDLGNFFTHLIAKGNLSNVVSSFSVLLIHKLRVVLVFLIFHVQ